MFKKFNHNLNHNPVGAIFGISLSMLLEGEIKQVNVTYVCPTARKYMNEQEIKEIEGESNN